MQRSLGSRLQMSPVIVPLTTGPVCIDGVSDHVKMDQNLVSLLLVRQEYKRTLEWKNEKGGSLEAPQLMVLVNLTMKARNVTFRMKHQTLSFYKQNRLIFTFFQRQTVGGDVE